MIHQPKQYRSITGLLSTVMLLSILASSVQCKSLQDFLDKQAAALGGRKMLNRVASYIVRSNVGAGGMKGTAVSYFKAPDKFRVDLSLPVTSYSQGCVGENCWMIDNQGTARSLGIPVAVEAAVHTAAGLVDALVRHLGKR